MTQLSKLILIFVPSSREKDDRHRGELKALTRWRICKIHCYKGKRLEVASPVVYILCCYAFAWPVHIYLQVWADFILL